jgi:restriction system protein
LRLRADGIFGCEEEKVMNLWMIRTGKFGQFEALAFEKGLACLGFQELPDLSKVKSDDAMRELIQATHTDASTARVSNYLA